MAEDFPITVYHNPACGTSRNALAMIRAAGYEPTVIEYLQAGWTRPRLDELVAKTGLKPSDLIRDKGTPAAELGLLGQDVSDDTILTAMVEHPKLSSFGEFWLMSEVRFRTRAEEMHGPLTPAKVEMARVAYRKAKLAVDGQWHLIREAEARLETSLRSAYRVSDEVYEAVIARAPEPQISWALRP